MVQIGRNHLGLPGDKHVVNVDQDVTYRLLGVPCQLLLDSPKVRLPGTFQPKASIPL